MAHEGEEPVTQLDKLSPVSKTHMIEGEMRTLTCPLPPHMGMCCFYVDEAQFIGRARSLGPLDSVCEIL